MGQRTTSVLASVLLLLATLPARADAPPEDPAKEPAATAASEPEPAPPPAKADSEKAAAPAGMGLPMIVGLIVGGVGLVSFVPGGVLIAHGQSVGADADALTTALPSSSACAGADKHADCATIQANLQTEEDFVAAGTITMAAGGVLVVSGVLLIVTAVLGSGDDAPATSAFLPWAGPDGAGATWSSSF